MGLLELAGAALVGAERRTEIAARNISNAQTPGYKGEVAYTEIAEAESHGLPITRSAFHNATGTLTDTRAPLDLAIRGDGYLLVRDDSRFFLSRGGQLRRDAQGALVDANGRVVQQTGGGDLILDTDTPEILPDGTVLSDAAPVGSIAVMGVSSAQMSRAKSGFTEVEIAALVASERSELRQGMLERSNVVLSDEMVGLMRNQRLAEGGAQLVRAYDQLIGQAATTFGRKN